MITAKEIMQLGKIDRINCNPKYALRIVTEKYTVSLNRKFADISITDNEKIKLFYDRSSRYYFKINYNINHNLNDNDFKTLWKYFAARY